MTTYKRHRFPPDIISYAVWLYYRFNLSHRDVEDLLAVELHGNLTRWGCGHNLGPIYVTYPKLNRNSEGLLEPNDSLIRF